MAGPGEESSRRGTEAICLCSGPVGRSHTEKIKQVEGWTEEKKGEKYEGAERNTKQQQINLICKIANHQHLSLSQ